MGNEKMRGLALCERYFQTHGLSMILTCFPRYEGRMACGLVGDGSECYGFDDEISRDHDWGPGFCIWLTSADYGEIAPGLKQQYDQLPATFSGFGPRNRSQWGDDRVGIFETGAFYSRFIGCSRDPLDDDEWLRIPEQALAAVTNGKVFRDPLGEFTAIRKRLLEFYPDDVRLKKMAARCMSIAQSGQYNLARCLRRGEEFAARYAETKFCADVISMFFLINRQYTPFYKWMSRALEGLPRMGRQTRQRVDLLIQTDDSGLKLKLAEEICASIIAELRAEGLTGSSSAFLLDHGPIIQSRIRNNSLRERNVWVG